MLESTIKQDRLRWLKPVDDNLRTPPKQFWKYFAKFKNNEHTAAQIKTGHNFITEPQLIAEASAHYFPSVFNVPSCRKRSPARDTNRIPFK